MVQIDTNKWCRDFLYKNLLHLCSGIVSGEGENKRLFVYLHALLHPQCIYIFSYFQIYYCHDWQAVTPAITIVNTLVTLPPPLPQQQHRRHQAPVKTPRALNVVDLCPQVCEDKTVKRNIPYSRVIVCQKWTVLQTWIFPADVCTERCSPSCCLWFPLQWSVAAFSTMCGKVSDITVFITKLGLFNLFVKV